MAEKLLDREFVIYRDRNVFLGGKIEDGQLKLESMVYGDDYDSEQHLEFTADDTFKIFSLMSFEEFVVFLQENHLRGFNDFLIENGIIPKTTTL